MPIDKLSTMTPMDFAGLANLRREVSLNPDESSIKEVAQQFESLFVQMAVKSMRDAVPKSDLFASDQMDMYQDMYDKQLSMELSRSGGLGLAKMIEAQLGGAATAPEVKNMGTQPITQGGAPQKRIDHE